MAALEVYLHARSVPDYWTDDLQIYRDATSRFGWSESQFVFANDLADILDDTPIMSELANTEDSTMVIVKDEWAATAQLRPSPSG